MNHRCRPCTVVLAVVAVALASPAGALAKVTFKRFARVNATPAPAVAMARTPNGTLHLVYQSYSGNVFSGLTSQSISPSGAIGPAIPALSGWTAGQPGLVALPNGTLEAFFSATSPGNVDGVWGITSANGGATWSAPTIVGNGALNEAAAFASDVTAAISFGTPVLSLPQAGNLVIQTGLGPSAASYQLTNAVDGSMTDADLAVDAATGRVVASWQSVAGYPRLWLQGAAQSVGSPQPVPGQSRNALVIAGRDKGSGVFGAYTPDGTRVRLLRYGGGSVAVGSYRHLTAQRLGVATGLDGRIWVMWGNDSVPGGVVVTRSNKAVTRFEPIQYFNPNAGSLYRISGDGRLGPLDLLVNEIPNSNSPAGEYYARVLPMLSANVTVAHVKNKFGKLTAIKVRVAVNDAGDPVSGATVSLKGKKTKTNKQGVANLTLPPSAAGKATVTITDAGYNPLSKPTIL